MRLSSAGRKGLAAVTLENDGRDGLCVNQTRPLRGVCTMIGRCLATFFPPPFLFSSLMTIHKDSSRPFLLSMADDFMTILFYS